MARHAEKRPGFGRRIGIRALRADEEILPYNIGLTWGPTHPRRRRWEQRMALKHLLGRRARQAVGAAMRRSQRDFVAWAREQGLGARVADATGLTLKAFWRAVRGRAPPPETPPAPPARPAYSHAPDPPGELPALRTTQCSLL
jgi:hypothetical protein